MATIMNEKKPVICLDAGHYAYYNQSPANKKYWESKAMWKLTMMQKEYLEELGFEVILTRDKQEVDLALTQRGKKSVGCVCLVSNHSNAVGSRVDENVDRATAYCLVDNKTTKIDEISREIGELLTNTVTEVMELKQAPAIATRLSDDDRDGDGKRNDNYYGILHGAFLVGTPALILEHSFHTNTRSTNWLLNDDNLEKLAKAEAEALAKYFGVEKEESAPTYTVNPLNGTVEVTYKGADGLNVRRAPSMGDNVAKVVHGGKYKVVGISADGEWYKLEDGLYITTNVKYVRFEKEVAVAPFKPYMVKIDVDAIFDKCLNVREKPDASSKKVETITKDMSVTIIEEAKDNGGSTWGLLKGYSKYRNGWINLYYVKKV